MGLTLNIATMVRARIWLTWGILIAFLVVWIEILLMIAAALDFSGWTLAFPVTAFAVLIAQLRILGITRSSFARISSELWRVYAFIALALFYFICASVAIGEKEPFLPVYFGLLSVGLIYPGFKIIRALKTIGNEIGSVADPSVLNAWLYGSRPTIPKSGVIRQRLPRAVLWFTFGACCILSLVALYVFQESGIVSFGTAGFVFPLGLIAIYCFKRGQRHIKLRASELKNVDQRGPVLLLRSFKDDQLRIMGRNHRFLKSTLEEVISTEASLLGPPITIGEPGEKLPPLGASREYLLHTEWKTAVSTLIDEAALVIFLLGDTDNLFWEFSTTIGRRGKNVLLVVVPPLRKQRDLQLRWSRFVEANAAFLGPAFPRQLTHEAVVAFFFQQNEPILIVGKNRTWWNYALGIRLFVSLYQRRLSSIEELMSYLSTHVPTVLR